ncbi:unnamed protein product [Lymnaea stagnalis]|uniref:Fibronectin type-III domain-containing protein n=1 Tax=Lymnaea stagnalis TaxID=6523 RepID=A0AAV2HG72_LYMST
MHMNNVVRGSRARKLMIVFFCFVLGVASDDVITTCRNEPNEKSAYVALDQPAELTFCVKSGSPLRDLIFYNGIPMHIGHSDTARSYFTQRHNEMLQENMLTFHIRRTSLVDYTRNSIILHNLNDGQIMLYAFVKNLGLNFHKQFSVGEVTLTCESTNTSIDQVSIHNQWDQTPLQSTVVGKTLFSKFNVNCHNVGRYYCRSRDTKDEEQFLDVHKSLCPPKLCNPNQSINDILSTLGQSVTFKICVIAYPKLSNQIVINGWKYTANGVMQDRFMVNHKQTDMYNYINVTINPVQETDVLKENQIKFYTSDNAEMMLRFFLSLKEGPPEFCRSTALINSISAPLGQRAQIPFCIVQPVSFRTRSLNVSVNSIVFLHSGCSGGFCVDFSNSSRIGHNVTLSVMNMSLQHYGVLSVKFSWAMSTNELTTQVMVKPIGPPQCPSDIQVINHRDHLVSIRWRPGYDAGGDQTFNVTLETADIAPRVIDQGEYTADQNGTLGFSLNDLEDDTSYKVNIIPVNKFGINDGCKSTGVFKTDFTKSLNFTLKWADDKRSISFTCSTPSFSRLIHIYKHRLVDPLKSFRPNNIRTNTPMVVTYVIPNITCQSIGEYQCVFISDSGERVTKTLEVKVDKCPPMPCENQFITPGIVVREGYTPKVPLCLMAYPGLDRSVVVNRNVLLHLPTLNNTVDIEMLLNQTGLYHYVNISFRGPTVSRNTRFEFKFTATNHEEAIYEFELIAPSKIGSSHNNEATGSLGQKTTLLAVFLVVSLLCTVLFLLAYHFRVRNRQRCVSCRSLADSTYLLGASSRSISSRSTTHGTWNPQYDDTVSCVMSNGKWIPLTEVMSHGSLSRKSLKERHLKRCQEFDLNTSADSEALLMCSTCGSSVFNKSMDDQEA